MLIYYSSNICISLFYIISVCKNGITFGTLYVELYALLGLLHCISFIMESLHRSLFELLFYVFMMYTHV